MKGQVPTGIVKIEFRRFTETGDSKLIELASQYDKRCSWINWIEVSSQISRSKANFDY